MAKKKWITAAELMRQLESNPEWVAKRDAKEARRADREKQLTADEASVVADLANVGVIVSSVYEFVGNNLPPPAALPVLVRHLRIDHHPKIREGLIRALSVPSARVIAFEILCDIFTKERDPNLRWVTANALAGMARFEEVKSLSGIEAFAALFTGNE